MAAITSVMTDTSIDYPESDGKPMAETDVHIDALIYLRETLKAYFGADPLVYVAGNMLLYYEEGNPAACVAPDVFVVRGVPKQERRTYKLWEEAHAPTVIFEITSKSTRLEDLGTKRVLYARLGIQEYFLYDPLGEYLRPPLQGYRLREEEYERMVGAPDVGLVSEALGVVLALENGRLRVVDLKTGERLLTPAEAYTARHAAEVRVRVAEVRVREEAAQRQAAEARAAHAEAELARLRAEMARVREGE